MDLNEVAVFVKVVQVGSFSRAAEQLNMPNSTVSSKLSKLESRLGVTLIQRTTRKLRLTPAGERYLDRCRDGIAAIEKADNEMAACQSEAQGLLRITGTVEMGATILPPLVSKFLAKYPKVSVELLLTDRRIDLLSEGVDLAIRAGALEDSTLIVKRIGVGHFGLYAAPKYLREHGTPKTPRDLQQHRGIHFTSLGTPPVWELRNAKERVKIKMANRVATNNLAFARAMCVAGEGIAIVPAFYTQAEERGKKLRRILPEWHSNVTPIQFVYPASRFVTPQLTAFMALATDALRTSFES